MTVAFSTSSAWASFAAFDAEGRVLGAELRHAPQQASGACTQMLQGFLTEKGIGLAEVRLFAADIGPGSFTGVRVGVVLAKTLAFTQGALVAGADAFDLVSPDRTVALPSKKGEFFIRVPGEPPYRSGDLPPDAIGYGNGIEPAVPPTAEGFARLLDRLTPEDPTTFAPAYLIEPSISIPKRPYRHAP